MGLGVPLDHMRSNSAYVQIVHDKPIVLIQLSYFLVKSAFHNLRGMVSVHDAADNMTSCTDQTFVAQAAHIPTSDLSDFGRLQSGS